MIRVWVIVFLVFFVTPAGTGSIPVPGPEVAEDIVDNDDWALKGLKGEMADYFDSLYDLDNELEALNSDLDKMEAVNLEIGTVMQLMEPTTLPVLQDSPTQDKEFHIEVRKKDGNRR